MRLCRGWAKGSNLPSVWDDHGICWKKIAFILVVHRKIVREGYCRVYLMSRLPYSLCKRVCQDLHKGTKLQNRSTSLIKALRYGTCSSSLKSGSLDPRVTASISSCIFSTSSGWQRRVRTQRPSSVCVWLRVTRIERQATGLKRYLQFQFQL